MSASDPRYQKAEMGDRMDIPAGFDISDLISLLLSESEEPVVIWRELVRNEYNCRTERTSLGKTPGAIVFTRTLVSMKVVANMRPKCVAAALEDAYAN